MFFLVYEITASSQNCPSQFKSSSPKRNKIQFTVIEEKEFQAMNWEAATREYLGFF